MNACRAVAAAAARCAASLPLVAAQRDGLMFCDLCAMTDVCARAGLSRPLSVLCHKTCTQSSSIGSHTCAVENAVLSRRLVVSSRPAARLSSRKSASCLSRSDRSILSLSCCTKRRWVLISSCAAERALISFRSTGADVPAGVRTHGETAISGTCALHRLAWLAASWSTRRVAVARSPGAWRRSAW